MLLITRTCKYYFTLIDINLDISFIKFIPLSIYGSMNEALRLLRKIQQEVRQSQSESEEDNLTKGYDACADK